MTTQPARVNVTLPDPGPAFLATRQPSALDIRANSGWQETLALEMAESIQGAQIVVTATVDDTGASGWSLATVDVQVIAYINQQRFILHRAQLRGEAAALYWTWNHRAKWDRLAVEVQKLIDGAPASANEPRTLETQAEITVFLR